MTASVESGRAASDRIRRALAVSLVMLGVGLTLAPIGCGVDDPPTPPGPPTPPAPDYNKALCGKKTLEPWSRRRVDIGGAVSFNEILYRPGPASDPKLEWIELYNPLAIDVDLSGFRLDGAIRYTFPSNTLIAARRHLVIAADADLLAKAVGSPVAVGSYTGQLPDRGGTVELWNNAGRRLDAVTWSDVEPWPVIAAGSGASLAKRSPELSSDPAESWTASTLVGGTPGAANFADPLAPLPARTLVPDGATWRYLATGTDPGPDWSKPTFDDSAWPSAPSTFYASDTQPTDLAAAATFTADNYFALYVGKADGSNLRYIGRDAVGDWQSAETLRFTAAPDEHVFVAAWEAPGNHGGPQSLIGQIALPGGAILGTDPSTFEWVIGPKNGSPGGALTDPPPALATLQGIIKAANQSKTWAAPQATAENSSSPWGGALAGVFAAATRFIWADTFGDVSIANTENTFLLFRTRKPIVPSKGTTKVGLGPTTYYFRTKLQVPTDVELVQPWIDALVDDGAVFYLNGAEVARLRMPAGPVASSTLAAMTVTDATPSPGILIDAGALRPGENVLAVEVHQAAVKDPDMTYGASLRTSVRSKASSGPPRGLALHEIAGGGKDMGPFWLELTNRSTTPIELGGHVIASSFGPEHVLAAGTLAPGELLLVDAARLGFSAAAGDKLFLLAPDRRTVLDGIEVASVARGRGRDPARSPSQSDLGPWLYPDVSTPGAPNQFISHDAIVINEILYNGTPVVQQDGSLAKSPLEWIELYNRGDKPVGVGGWQLVDAVEYELPAGLILPPGAYLVVTNDVDAMKAAHPSVPTDRILGDFKRSLADSGESIVLRDACGNPVDAVHYHDGGRWPDFTDGGGSSLELRDPRADNSVPEAWAASDQSTSSDWQTITYEGVAKASSVGPDGVWQEFVIGLLDAGVVLLDDISVIVDPAGAAPQLITNGTFDSGSSGGGTGLPAAFRLLGNHRHSQVIPEPGRPANRVLRLVATGPTEHMHNHLEITLANNHKITNGQTYRISLRAKWLAGSNHLNTRLYFNRLARTTRLAMPSHPGTPGAPNSTLIDNIGPTYQDLQHWPAVPGPYEPVIVSVIASDPDGVGDLALWYAVNGGPPERIPMVAAPGDGREGRFTAQVPGRPAATLVQFWIAGKDARGATSYAPALGPASRALWKVDDGLAATNGLHNVRILLAPADAAFMFERTNLMSNDPVGATIIYDEREAYYDVGVRLKSSERGRPEVPRVGFALRFGSDRPFRGVYKSVMVDRSEGVNFGQRQMLINQVMNRAGSVTSHYNDLIKVLTPRPEHTSTAELQLARFGDLLLDHQLEGGGDGMLFEYELIYYPTTTDNGTPLGYKLPKPDSVVGTAIRDLGDDKESYRLPFIIKNNRWRDDYRGLIAWAKVFGQTGAAYNDRITEVIDVDQWLRAFAFATLSGAIDNYASGAAHNADFYVRPTDGRVLYFPHDLDFYGGSPQSAVVANADLNKLIADPARARVYYGHLYDIITTAYNGTYMAYWCDHLGKLLPGQDFAAHLRFITARADWVLNTASNAVMKAIPKIAFKITTNAGAPLAVTTPTVTLDGTGWIDIAEIQRPAPPRAVAVTWKSQSAWQASIALECGPNPITLEALDRYGRPVGTSAITVTRSGAGCP